MYTNLAMKILKILAIIFIFFIWNDQVERVQAFELASSEALCRESDPINGFGLSSLGSQLRSDSPPSYSVTNISRFYADNGPGKGLIGASDAKLSLADYAMLLLPDLETLPPTDLIIQEIRASGQKLLKFTNSIINNGPGILELKGEVDVADGNASISQQIYSIDDSIIEREVSDYVFHPVHDHWHFDNFARYELWTIASDWRLGTLVSLSDKVSFCLRDIERSESLDSTARAVFTRCGQESQGISPGWIDTYLYYYDGQSLDITDLPYGSYILRSIADPDDQLWEVDSTNNVSLLYIRIEGNNVEVIDNPLDLKAKDKFRRID
jgi:hypothetical protein